MKSNPGGQIPPSEVIGRDGLVGRLWNILERQSLILTAERRMGKTHVIKKMMSEGPRGTLMIPGNKTPSDLERVHTSLEFVENVFFDVEKYLSGFKRTAEKARRFLVQIGGTEFKGFKFPSLTAPHWKTLLTEAIEDLMAQQDQLVVFFWDELPLMLHNLKQREGEVRAMEVLDTLRALRQTYPKIRMVFTGSIGLHLVLTSLRRAGYANDPTNDMYVEDVQPLALPDAVKLAVLLLEGENVSGDNLEKTAEEIATAVDRIPHYIHHVVDQIKNRGGLLTAGIVDRVVCECLTDSQDRWHMAYYRQRLDTYYEAQEKLFALHLLDILCTSSEPISFAELFNFVKSRVVTEDAEAVRNVLDQLRRDHYVIQHGDGTFGFRLPLVKRSWKLQRGL